MKLPFMILHANWEFSASTVSRAFKRGNKASMDQTRKKSAGQRARNGVPVKFVCCHFAQWQ
jgi:hypothetical protein